MFLEACSSKVPRPACSTQPLGTLGTQQQDGERSWGCLRGSQPGARGPVPALLHGVRGVIQSLGIVVKGNGALGSFGCQQVFAGSCSVALEE